MQTSVFLRKTNFISFSTKAIAKILEIFFSIVNLINLTKFLETQKKKIAKFPKSQNLKEKKKKPKVL